MDTKAMRDAARSGSGPGSDPAAVALARIIDGAADDIDQRGTRVAELEAENARLFALSEAQRDLVQKVAATSAGAVAYATDERCRDDLAALDGIRVLRQHIDAFEPVLRSALESGQGRSKWL